MANAAEKKWMETISNWYENTGFSNGVLNEYQYDRHHVTGRKSKHNKVAIGHWFVLPIPKRYHDVSSNNPFNVTHYRHIFALEFGLQSELFKEMIESMVGLGVVLPFGDDVINSIMDTRR
jgi:hypothetical protein